MGCACISLVLTVIIVAIADADSTTTYFHNGQNCNLCGPGTYLVQHCTKTQDTRCAWCPSHTFTNLPHKARYCRQCKIFCTRLFEVITSNCTRTENMACACKESYYLRSEDYNRCAPYHVCGIGYGVRSPGTKTTNVICEQCREGFFSDVNSFKERCKAHTDCSTSGMVVNVPGNSTHDNVCAESQNNGNANHTNHGIVVPSRPPARGNSSLNDTGADLPHGSIVLLPLVTSVITAILIFVVLGILLWCFHVRIQKCFNWQTSPTSSTETLDKVHTGQHEPLVNTTQMLEMVAVQNPEGNVETRMVQLEDVSNGSVFHHDTSTNVVSQSLRKRVSLGSASDLHKDTTITNRPEFSRSNSRLSENRDTDLLSLKEFCLEDYNEETFRWFVVENIPPQENKWRKFLLNLPGSLKLRNTTIDYIYHDNFIQHGLQYVIVKCLEDWQQSNPGIDLVEAIITALSATGDQKYKALADKIAEQKAALTSGHS